MQRQNILKISDVAELATLQKIGNPAKIGNPENINLFSKSPCICYNFKY